MPTETEKVDGVLLVDDGGLFVIRAAGRTEAVVSDWLDRMGDRYVHGVTGILGTAGTGRYVLVYEYLGRGEGERRAIADVIQGVLL